MSNINRKFTPTVQATRRRDVEISGREDPAKVRFRPCLDPQSFQSRTSSQPPRNLQRKTHYRVGRMASTCSLITLGCRFYRSALVSLTMPSHWQKYRPKIFNMKRYQVAGILHDRHVVLIDFCWNSCLSPRGVGRLKCKYPNQKAELQR